MSDKKNEDLKKRIDKLIKKNNELEKKVFNFLHNPNELSSDTYMSKKEKDSFLFINFFLIYFLFLLKNLFFYLTILKT